MVAYGFPDPQKIRYEAVKDGSHERSLQDGLMDGSHHRKDGLMDESHKGVSMMVCNILQGKERKGGMLGI